jgi:hypothetical protein
MTDGGQFPLPPTPGGGGGGTVNGNSNLAAEVSSSTTATISKAYGKIVLTSDNVLLTKEKTAETPSFLDGMEPEIEWETRVVGCELISSAGILLKLPQVKKIFNFI